MSTSQNQWGHTVHTHYWNKTSLLIDSTCWVSQHADSGNMLIPSTCGVNQHDELSIMLSQSRCWVNQHAESIDVESINMLNQSTCALNQPVDSIKISWLTVVGRHNPPFSLQGQYHEIFVPVLCMILKHLGLLFICWTTVFSLWSLIRGDIGECKKHRVVIDANV